MSSLLFLLTVFLTVADGKTSSSVDSAAALLRLKHGVRDPMGTLRGWNESVNCCKWEGVDCLSQQGRVIGLHLQSLTLPSPDLLILTIQKLSHLRQLHVSRSQFAEPLSRNLSLAGCDLEVLDLSNNILRGIFPTELVLHCKNSLRLLNLSHNQLDGELGSNFVIGRTVETIDLSSNNFTGIVLSSLFQSCNSLRSFNLSNNRFAGSVPEEMVTHCPILEDVNLANNNLSGVLDFSKSSSIQRLILASNFLTKIAISCLNLTHLDASYNRLSGNIFNSSDSTCSSLKVLNISSNFYSGPPLLSLGLKNLELHSSLEVLDASHNSFTGELPKFHANLKHLDFSSNMLTKTSGNICPTDSKQESLILPNNRLTGPLLDSIVNCQSLQMLDLSFNELTGGIPDQLCSSLPKLQHLLAWGNGLEGPIPSTLGNCVNLITVILSHNKLNGSIPPELSGLHKLWWLSLSSNNLSGRIPSTFGELDNLVNLQLNNNSLEGEIPSEMDGSKSLRTIELASNSLEGKLPGRIGRKFSRVEATGVVPVETRLGNLRVARTPGPICKGSNILFCVQGIHLHELEMHLFARTGCFAHLNVDPPYVLNVSSPLIIEVSFNQLSGEIPEEFGLMQSLLVLNVAHNKLSGRIPEVLGNLEGMQVLDLSENALHGSIPASLSQLTFLFHFSVSYNNLSGRIPQNGQFLTFTERSYEGNPELCGLPLPTKCSAADPPVLPSDAHPISTGGIQDILVVGLVSGSIAFFICCGSTLYCSSKWKLVKLLVHSPDHRDLLGTFGMCAEMSYLHPTSPLCE